MFCLQGIRLYPPKGKKKELQYYFLIFIVFTADVGTVFTADVRETFDCYRFYRNFLAVFTTDVISFFWHGYTPSGRTGKWLAIF